MGDRGIDVDKYLSLGCIADEYSADDLLDLEEFLSDDEDFLPRVPTPPPDFSRVIVVDGLPEVQGKLIKRLIKYLGKTYMQVGEVTDVQMPTDPETGKTNCMAFVEFKTPAAASTAVASTDGFKFDDDHTLSVCHYSDLEKLVAYEEEYKAPPTKEFRSEAGRQSWLSDKACRDQFAIRYDGETEVHWGETKGAPVKQYGGEREKARGQVWTEMEVRWSNRGTFLATFHKRGIALWGGADFKKIHRLPHFEVHHMAFSDNERYLATWNGQDLTDTDEPLNDVGKGALYVWDVRTGQGLREFSQVQRGAEPDFGWSPQGKFLARLAREPMDLVQVYETPSMNLVGKSSIKVKGIVEMQWSPSDQIMVWWTPEREHKPACVTLTEFPSKRVVRTKNLVRVKKCSLYWQQAGDFLCVEVMRLTKTGKLAGTDFQLFRMKEKNIPIEILSIAKGIQHFAWEPMGTRFGVIHDSEGPGRFIPTFYDMGAPGSHHTALFTLEERPVDTLFWSPQGRHVIMAGIQNLTGERIEFFDVKKNTSLAVREHYLCTNILWDPSGRIATTAVCQRLGRDNPMRYTMQNGFSMWTFQGEPIHDEAKQKMYQFVWRPRPPSLLTKKERKNVAKNLRQHIQKYLADDRRKANRIKYKKFLDRYSTRQKFEGWFKQRKADYEAAKDTVVDIRGYDTDDEDGEFETHTYTIQLSKRVEEFTGTPAK